LTDLAFALVVTAAFIAGVVSSARLTRTYVEISSTLDWRARLVALTFVVVAWTITIAAGFFGALAVRRLLGAPPLDWSPNASAIVAAFVLFIPVALDFVWTRISGGNGGR
jgi:hypothetical protein